MRILRKELARIFSVKTILLLSVFTALFLYLFSHWSIYPKNYVDWPGAVPFREELFREFGGQISGAQWDLLAAKKDAYKKEVDKIISQNAFLAGVGITDYDRFRKRYREIEEKRSTGQELSGEEQEIFDFDRELWFSNQDSKELLFRMQECDHIMQERDHIAENKGDGSDAVSLVPDAVVQLLPNEFVRLVILVYVWCAALLLPWQIEKNLKGVYPLFLSTKEGRRVFENQMKASLVTGICVWAAVAGLYTVLLGCKHYFTFWNGRISNGWWIFQVELTVLHYWIFYVALLFLASLGCAALAWLIGRASRNHIAGLVFAILGGVLYCRIVHFGCFRILLGGWGVAKTVVKAAAFGGIVIFLLLAALRVIRWDRERDIL